ncbi:MAG: YifB family Mg chelatase-like AAA ATPase [Gammaproteobacteria bacterium]|nr:YifB family Mg chelatase-like AAA ATPase [Gammaproteobacteria bacterium]
MTLSNVLSRAQCGVDAPLVRVETHISNGLPAFSIVGLPATAVRESKDRVRSAIINSHFEWQEKRLTVNLSPADLPKDGGRFDLPIALGILVASGQVPEPALAGMEFIGELSLSGALRPIAGTVGAAIAASRAQRSLVVPALSAASAVLVPDAKILPVTRLLELTAHLNGTQPIQPATTQDHHFATNYADLADVRGQPVAKRALEIAAAGGHNLLFCGPPGTGKTMLASRLPGILPPLLQSELLQLMTIRSALDPLLSPENCWQRPFRAPHHSASAKALVGGGSDPRPGEISLAHCGVLFLDELPEFPRAVLDVLREPMESGNITLSRVYRQVSYPARFQLVAAMNPCPCGFDGDPQHTCRCTPDQIQRYRQRLSGPLLDRIDLLLNLPRIPTSLLTRRAASEEGSAPVRARVAAARARQLDRAGVINSQLNQRQLEADCALAGADQKLLEQATDELGLSMRAYHRILKVSRSIADLAANPQIDRSHLIEAMGYRQLNLEQIGL